MSHHKVSFARRLLTWYDREQRDLPWRTSLTSTGRPHPYHVLLSETMLQQTQVATVIPYFERFLKRFSTLQSLADADEQEVLRLWQGLGYYSRARNLLKAARYVVHELGGAFPEDPQGLLELPGVGRYTAGAIASIAFDRRAPILDGNVMRVLCRLYCIRDDPRAKETNARLWQLADEILPTKRIGDFNSALMELGATVCRPAAPKCLYCPVAADCKARDAGLQDQIPTPRKSKATPLVRRVTYCIESDGHFLIEQRPRTGRWASLWQFVTIDSEKRFSDLPLALRTLPRLIGKVRHALTHRRYEFSVYHAEASLDARQRTGESRRWVTLDGLDLFPLPRPHLQIADMLRQQLSLGTTNSNDAGSTGRPSD